MIFIDVDGLIRDLRGTYLKSDLCENPEERICSYYTDGFNKFFDKVKASDELCRKYYLDEAIIYPGALEKLNEIKEACRKGILDDWVILTANGFTPFCKKYTDLFLKENGFIEKGEEKHLIIAANGNQKPKIMADKGHGILLDDRIKTIKNLKKPSMGVWIELGYSDDVPQWEAFEPEYPKLRYKHFSDVPLSSLEILSKLL